MKNFGTILLICCLQAARCYSQAADLRVDLSHPGKIVNPNQFGIFIEEINHAGDGGLDGELIRNGSFMEASTLDAWSTVTKGSSRVNLFFDGSLPPNPVKTRSVRIEVVSSIEQRAGIANEGYWGIAVKNGESYEFSMYARGASGFDGPLTVSLEGKDGTVYGSAQIIGLQTGWHRFSVSLRAGAVDPAAHLTISADRSGTFWLNMVSLRRSGGDIFRPDLLDKLKSLRPGFVRFPGGTFVQGNDRESAFRWKDTIGELEFRRGHQNAPWAYWSTDSLGFHEYLLLCERLGASPLYVAYAGMTWTPQSKSPFGLLNPQRIPVNDYPLDEMEPVVADVVDAIEYANGPVTSKWGALRAKAGHPAPFGLKYVEIGNEDENNALYPERYMLIHAAIKARFPDIQIIANQGRGRNVQLPKDLVDEHVYTKPLGAIDMGKRLDDRDRNGPRSILAEYSVQTSAGFGNMRAALAEAIMLHGIERNSDIMPMAAYAPLLANVHAINWRPDLIYFDSASSYGTPSYYVQKMFADSRLASVVPVEINCLDLKQRMDGTVSAQGFGAQAEFRDEKIERNGENYTYAIQARKTGGDGGLVIRFASQNSGQSYLAWFLGVRHRASTLIVWGGGGNQDVPAYQLESSFSGAISPPVSGTIEPGRWYDVKIQIEGRRVRCYLDGKEIHDVRVPETFGRSIYGQAGLTTGGQIVVRLVNILPVKQSVTINLVGARAHRYLGVAASLAAKDLDDENSLAEPTRISPIEGPVLNVDTTFQYEMEGNSFTVLKLAPQKE